MDEITSTASALSKVIKGIGRFAAAFPTRMIDLDYATIVEDVESGSLRIRLAEQLAEGFRKLHDDGDALPPASYFAARIAEIIYANSTQEIDKTTAYDLYQEVLLACEDARTAVLGEEIRPA